MPLTRGAVAALNLLSCGPGAAASVACWFPDEAAVWLLDEKGNSRRLDLEGLPLIAPEVLLSSESPRKPIRDVFVAADGEIWVLGSGWSKPGADRQVGGWLLATYSSSGQISRRLELPEPARLVLSADVERCLLLASDGRVVEVRP